MRYTLRHWNVDDCEVYKEVEYGDDYDAANKAFVELELDTGEYGTSGDCVQLYDTDSGSIVYEFIAR